MMRFNRCIFRAEVDFDKVYRHNTIDVIIPNFFHCLSDCIQKPLSLRLRFDHDLKNTDDNTKEHIAASYAKDAMLQLKQVVIAQAEQFFNEFYHYNFEDMQRAIKDCIERGYPWEPPINTTKPSR